MPWPRSSDGCSKMLGRSEELTRVVAWQLGMTVLDRQRMRHVVLAVATAAEGVRIKARVRETLTCGFPLLAVDRAMGNLDIHVLGGLEK